MSDDDAPENCVRCDSDAITQLARLGIQERYACAECWAVFEWPNGKVVAEVQERWRHPDAAKRIRESDS